MVVVVSGLRTYKKEYRPMKYKLVKQVVHDDVLRNSFINLAIKTFDLSFKEWYKKGYWTESYIPYAFVDNNKVIANASANVIDLNVQPPRVVRTVGWLRCMCCGRFHFSEDVSRARLCLNCGGAGGLPVGADPNEDA